jgi:DNA-binding response OmpR family regulator
MKRLMFVEDDRSLGVGLYERLGKEGYDVLWVDNKAKAEIALRQQFFDLVILDLGLPDGNGFELAKKIRLKPRTSFLFLTAQSSAEDRLTGFELGAEEYIPKPFHLKELLLRVKHVLKKPAAIQEIKVNGCAIYLESMLVIDIKGEKKNLHAKDCEILKLLIDLSPRVVSRDEILDSVWGVDNYPSPRTVDNSIVRLRQLLNDLDATFIRSVRSVGYQWIGNDQ